MFEMKEGTLYVLEARRTRERLSLFWAVRPDGRRGHFCGRARGGVGQNDAPHIFVHTRWIGEEYRYVKNGYTYFPYQTPELVSEDKRPEGASTG